MGWSDVGSWDEMARLEDEASPLNSSSRAQRFDIGARDNYVYSVQNKVIGLIDVEGLFGGRYTRRAVDRPQRIFAKRSKTWSTK